LRSATDDPGAFDRTLTVLTNHRLLTIGGIDDRQVDLAHEALIQGWPEFRTWIDARRTAELQRRNFEFRALDWVAHGRGARGLLDRDTPADA